jgi:hypothetical protein
MLAGRDAEEPCGCPLILADGNGLGWGLSTGRWEPLLFVVRCIVPAACAIWARLSVGRGKPVGAVPLLVWPV